MDRSKAALVLLVVLLGFESLDLMSWCMPLLFFFFFFFVSFGLLYLKRLVHQQYRLIRPRHIQL